VRRLSRQTQKAPAGEDRGFCGLSVCRSNKPIRIVGGHNDAAKRMLLFYQNCNSYSGKLTTNCIYRTKTGPRRQWLTEPARVFALVVSLGQKIHPCSAFIVFPAKAGIHVSHRHRPSPV
jgi:hypothetical protein